MRNKSINGQPVMCLTGTIESVGPGSVFDTHMIINGLTFDDGETIRRPVLVENALAAWVSPNVSGEFLFVDGPRRNLSLVAVDPAARGLRTADPGFAQMEAWRAIGSLVPLSVVAAILTAMTAHDLRMAYISMWIIIPVVVYLLLRLPVALSDWISLNRVRRVIQAVDNERRLPSDRKRLVAGTI